VSLSKKGFFLNGFIPDAAITRSNMGGSHDYSKLYRRVAMYIRWASDRINNKDEVVVSFDGFSDEAIRAVLQTLRKANYLITPIVHGKSEKTIGIIIYW